MRIQEITNYIDQSEGIHLARLLILIGAFEQPDRPAIEGITKLAKLDFLLRYPTYFERAVVKRGGSPPVGTVPDYERHTVEAQMVRYRFGPWDHRLRRFLNLLAARGLIKISVEGRTVMISSTKVGIEAFSRLSALEEFRSIAERARVLKKRLDIGATNLMKFIYETFPEIASLDFNEAIQP
ncbi:MAG: hypothetical protein ABSB50_18325 [Terracidiphilus sp.]|jgi:hypothetical protein